MAASRTEMDMADGWEWVPASTIYVDETISPRTRAYVDPRRVAQYAEIWDQLPPIEVQKDTFKLIDGAHRLTASYQPEASTVLVKIIERAIPDDEMREAAYDANTTHGVSLSPDERVEFMKYILAKHTDWSDSQVARRCGVARRTVLRHRQAGVAAEARAEERQAVIGTDGKQYPVKPKVEPIRREPVEDDSWPAEEESELVEGVIESQPDTYEGEPMQFIDNAIVAIGKYGMAPKAFWWALRKNPARQLEIKEHIDTCIVWVTELDEVINELGDD